MNANDEKILQLKKVVNAKKKQIDELKSKGTSYKTKLVFEFDGNKYNLNVCSVEALQFLLLKLGMYQKEAISQEINFTIESRPIEDWLSDIKTKLRLKDIKQKEDQLKLFEDKLEAKLSTDTKDRIELDDMDDILGKFEI